MVAVAVFRRYFHKNMLSYHFTRRKISVQRVANSLWSIARQLYGEYHSGRAEAARVYHRALEVVSTPDPDNREGEKLSEELRRTYSKARKEDCDPIVKKARTAEVQANHKYSMACNEFKQLRIAKDPEYWNWLRLTRALVETLPLGLDSAKHWKLLQYEYGIVETDASKIDHLSELLAKEVIDELAGFLDDETLDELAKRLGRPFRKIADLLPRQSQYDTLSGRIRNDMRDVDRKSGRRRVRHRRNHLISLLETAEAEGRASIWIKGKDLEERWLCHSGCSLAGRITRPCFGPQTRRKEYEAAIEEMRIRIAYEIVAAGYQLIACDGSAFVVAITDVSTASAEQQRQITQVIEAAGTSLTGSIAPQCRVRQIPTPDTR
jgi:hypothetical protein